MSQPWEPAAVGLRQPCRRSGTCRTRFRKTIVKKLKREGPGRGVSSIRQTHVGFGGLPGRRRPGEPPGAQPRPGDICAQEQGHREAMARPPPQQSPDPAGGLPGARKRFHSELSIQGYEETKPSDDAALQKTGERTRRGPEPQTHSTCSQLCDGQNFAPPPPGKKNHVLGTWPERTRRSVSCKITRDKTSSLKHEKKKTQEVRREN